MRGFFQDMAKPGISFALLIFHLMLCFLNRGGASSECGRYRVLLNGSTVLRLSSEVPGTNSESPPGFYFGSRKVCERLCIPGLQRFQHIKKYAHTHKVTVHPEEDAPNKRLSKIELCLHRNLTLPLGQCPYDWKMLDKGLWTASISPFETKYLDIRWPDSFFESLTISIEEEFWSNRLVFLVTGIVLLILAPIVSKWVPFYYSSAMAFGVIVVIIIIAFQGMKLLPTGRKGSLYVIIFGSIVGFGSVCVNYLSNLAGSILHELGFGEEMLNPVALFILICLGLAGAYLGLWGVRKLVLSEDGRVDVTTAYFVEWAIRIVAAFMILQSSHDPLLAVLMLAFGAVLASILRFGCYRLLRVMFTSHSEESPLWVQRSSSYPHAQFLCSHPQQNTTFLGSDGTALRWSPYNPQNAAPPVTPLRSTSSTPSRRVSRLSPLSHVHSTNSSIDERDYYSSYHKLTKRKFISKEEYNDLTKTTTKKALKELYSTPEFAEWALSNSDRIATTPVEHREENSSKRKKDLFGGWFSW